MSRETDTKVVEMQFDNKEFEKNVQSTLDSLQKLKENLNMKGAAQGFTEISKAASAVDLKPIAENVEDLKEHFTGFGIFVDQIFRNVANSAYSFARQTIGELTGIVKAGMGTYESRVNATQTLMASTGEDIDAVNAALAEMLDYSDKTIYSFNDMTSNITKFTNAGVGLEDAVVVMEGLANLAAVSGANANQAAQAMYNLGQSMSRGYVQRIDWNSVSTASMDTAQSKSVFLQTAEELGTLIKLEGQFDAQGEQLYQTMNGNVVSVFQEFNESLADGWFTTDVLTESMYKYIDTSTELGRQATDAATKIKTFSQLIDTTKESMSTGWSTTFTYLLGDFEQAKGLWGMIGEEVTAVTKAIADARNAPLKYWNEYGGYDMLVDSIRNVIDAIKSLVGPIAAAWGEVFKPLNAGDLMRITMRIKDFTKNLILNEDAQEKIWRVARAIFSVVKVGKDIVSGVIKVVGSLLGVLRPAGSVGLDLLDVVSTVLEYIVRVINESGVINGFFTFISDGIRWVIGKISALLEKLREIFPFGDWLSGFFSKLSTGMSDLSFPTFEQFLDWLKATFNQIRSNETVASIIETLQYWVGEFGRVLEAFDWNGIGAKFLGFFEDVKNGTIKEKIADKFSQMLEKLSETIEKVSATIKKVSDYLKEVDIPKNIADTWTAISNWLKGAWGWVKDTASGIDWENTIKYALMIFVGVKALTMIYNAVTAVTRLVNSVSKVFKASATWIKSKARENNAEAFKTFAESVKTIAEAMGIMAGTITLLGSINKEKLIRGGIALAVMATVILGAYFVISKLNAGMDEGGDGGLLGSVKDLLGKIGKGVEIIALMAALAIFVKALGEFAKVIELYTNLKIENPVETIIKIVGSIILLIGAIWLIGKAATANALGIVAAVAALFAIEFALVAFIGVLKLYEKIKFENVEETMEKIGKVLLLLGGVMLAFGAAARLGGVGMIGAALMLVGIVGALGGVLFVILAYSRIPWDVMERGLKGMAFVLAELVAAVDLLSIGASAMNIRNAIAALIAMGALVAAVMLLTPTLITLGNLSEATLLKGGITLGALLIVLAGATKILMSGGFSKGQITKAIGNLITLAGLAGAMIGVAFALKIVAGIPTAGIVKSVIALGIVFAVMKGLMKSLSGVKWSAAGVLVAMSIAIGSITAALWTLAIVPTKDLVSGTVVLGVLIGMMALLGKSVQGAGIQAMATLVIMGLVIGALAYVISLIVLDLGDKIDYATKFTVSLAAMISGLGIAFALIGKLGIMSAIEGALGLAAGIMLFLVAIAIIGTAFQEIYGLETYFNKGIEILIKLAAGLGDAIGQFVGNLLNGLMEGVGSGLESFGLHLSNFWDNAEGFFKGVETANWDKILDGIGSIALAIAAFGAAELVEGLGALFQMFSGNNDGLGGFGERLADFAKSLVRAAFYLQLINDKTWNNFGNAAGVLERFVIAADAIPNSGGLAGIFAGNNDIDVFSEGLVSFAKNLADYSDAISGVKNWSSVILSATAAAELVKAFSDIPATDWDTQVFGAESDLVAFGKSIAAFAPYLKSFSDNVKGINTGLVSKAGEAAGTLAAFANSLSGQTMNNAQITLGQNSSNFEKFGRSMASFAPYLKVFSDTITAGSGIDANAITSAGNASKAFAEFANALPSKDSSGYEWLVGTTQNIVTLGDNMIVFGNKLRAYVNIVGGKNPITTEDVEGSTNAAKVLAELENGLPRYGGVVGEWLGDKQTLHEFADNITYFANKLRYYINIVNGTNPITASDVEASASAAKVLTALANEMPEYDGTVKGWFTSDKQTLQEFGEGIGILAEGLVSFSSKVKDADTWSIDRGKNLVKGFVDLANIVSSLSEGNTLSDFAPQIYTFGQYLYDYYGAVADIKWGVISQSAGVFKEFSETFASIDSQGGFEGITNFSSALKDLSEVSFANLLGGFDAAEAQLESTEAVELANAAKIAMASMLAAIQDYDVKTVLTEKANNIVGALRDKYPEFAITGRAFISKISDGMSDDLSMSKITNAAKLVADDFQDAFYDSYSLFYNIGKYIDDGIADGVNQHAWRVTNAAQSLAYSTSRALRYSLQINSPSKLTMEMGEYLDLGLVEGMKNMTSAVVGEGQNVGNTMISTMKSAIQQAAATINNDIDTQPTIRPVLDLSNVTNGVRTMNGMFNRNRQIGMLGDISNGLSGYSNRGINTTETNTFYIQSTDPQGAADEVSKILQRQYDRRNAVWA